MPKQSAITTTEAAKLVRQAREIWEKQEIISMKLRRIARNVYKGESRRLIPENCRAGKMIC
jgi:hypothetical protein